MDPLSIATGAATLAVTGATLVVRLNKYIRDVTQVDARIQALVQEVTTLTDSLDSVKITVRKCHDHILTLALLDEQIWQKMDSTLVDCGIALEELGSLLGRLKSESKTPSFIRALKKPSMHFKLNYHMDDISDFMSKVYKLNCGLQTSLAMLNISLSFRANASQDLLFGELRGLKALVEESLSATRNSHPDLDPFNARLTRNLQSLAQIAQQFHSTASSTASTRHGDPRRQSTLLSWGGSEPPRLTDFQRERIGIWNNSAIAMEPVEEEHDDAQTATTATGSGNVLSSPATVITEPDLEEKRTESRPVIRRNSSEDMVDSDDDSDSDMELDFLKNFDELACTSFAQKDYPKAELFFHKAIERSTGETTGQTDFKLLRIRLALCCCLQQKWEFAAGALTSLSKSKTASNLLVFHVLQAVSLGYMENERFDEAYRACKDALLGKKKILGRADNDYHECLSTLALIYEKRGDPLEAEALRLSLPSNWPHHTPISSGLDYVLNHPNLIDAAFDKKPLRHIRSRSPRNDAEESAAETAESTETITMSGHWTTLVRNQPLDGMQRATMDENEAKPLGNTDTGKEFILQSTDNPMPRPFARIQTSKAFEDEHSGKQVGEFDSGKEVFIQSDSGVAGPSQDHRSAQTAPNVAERQYVPYSPVTKNSTTGDELFLGTMVPSWPMSHFCSSENLVKRWEEKFEPYKHSKIRSSDWYSTIEHVEQYSTLEAVGVSDLPEVASTAEPLNRNGLRAVIDIALKSPKNSSERKLLNWKFTSAVDVRSEGSLVTSLLVPLLKTAARSLERRVGVNICFSDASFAISGVKGEFLCDSMVNRLRDASVLSRENVPPSSNSSWTDYPWNFIRLLTAHDEELVLSDSSPLFSNRLIPTEFSELMDKFDATAAICRYLKYLETMIAAEITSNKDNATCKQICSVSVSIPDILLVRIRDVLSYSLGTNALFKNARLIPSSLAIINSFIDSELLPIAVMVLQTKKPKHIIVLNCDEILVECTSYVVEVHNETHARLSPGTRSWAELCGSLHAEMEFVKIALAFESSVIEQLGIDMTERETESSSNAIREYFKHEVLPLFKNDGSAFKLKSGYLRNRGFSDALVRSNQLIFDNEVMLDCFQPSMRSIRKILVAAVMQLCTSSNAVTHVLIAGQYSTSVYLCEELKTAVSDLGMGVTLVTGTGGVAAISRGVLYFQNQFGS